MTANLDKSRNTRARGTPFPYYHLDGCAEIVANVHALGGGSCGWDQLAAWMGRSSTSGNFRQNMNATRMFGLLDYKNKRIQLTQQGNQLLIPELVRQTKVEAFLEVSVFRQAYERLKGTILPTGPAIENALTEIGVTASQAPRARQVFLRSARDAGFFEINPDRLVKPVISESSTDEPSAPADEEVQLSRELTPQRDPSQGIRVHSLIRALLEQLPEEGSEWEPMRCVMWLQGLLISLGMIYSNFDDLRRIEVTFHPGERTGPALADSVDPAALPPPPESHYG